MWRPARLAALPLAIAASAPLAASRAPARAENLTAALVLAYRHNTDLAAAQAQLRATDEQVPQAQSAWRPTVNITSGVGRQDQTTGTSALLPVPLSYRQWSYGGGVKLDWPVYQGGRRGADLQRAEETVAAARADLLGTEQNVLLEAATSYSDVQRTRRLLKLYREQESVLERQVRETTIRKDAGQLTETDVLQAENRLEGARVTRIGAEGDAAAAVARYVAAVGRPPTQDMANPGRPPGLPPTVAEAVRLATANSPTVIASLHRAEAANHAISVAYADLLPSVNFSVQGSIDQGQTSPTVPARYYAATLNMTLPLYQNGGTESRLRQARENASQSRIQIFSSQRDARKAAEQDFAQWRAAADQEKEQRREVQIAEAAYDAVRREAAVGAKSEFELLSQLQELYEARTREVTTAYNEVVQSYQLLAAIGRFTAADLGLPTAIYDPTAHYRAVTTGDGTVLPWLTVDPPARSSGIGDPPGAAAPVSGAATRQR